MEPDFDLPRGVRGEGDTLRVLVRMAPSVRDRLKMMATFAILAIPVVLAMGYFLRPGFADQSLASHAKTVVLVLLGGSLGFSLPGLRSQPVVGGAVRLTPTHLEVGAARHRLDSLIDVSWEGDDLVVDTLETPYRYCARTSDAARAGMVELIRERLRERGDVGDVPPELRRMDRRPRLFQHLR